MQCRSGGTANQQGNLQTALLHHTGHIAHFLKRRRYQSAKGHKVGITSNRFIYNVFGSNHHAQVHNFYTVTVHDNGNYILTYVMHVALHCGKNHTACRMTGNHLLFLLINIWSKPVYGRTHRTGTLYHLRQKHLSLAKQFAYTGHTRHQWAVNNRHRRTTPCQYIGKQRYNTVNSTLYYCIFNQLFRHQPGTSRNNIFFRHCHITEFRSQFDKSFSSFSISIKNYIVYGLE